MGSLPGPTSKLLLLLLPVGSSCCGFLGADRLGSLPKNLVHVALVFFILPFAFHAWLYRVLWHSTTPPTDFGSTAVVVAVQNVGRFIYFPLSPERIAGQIERKPGQWLTTTTSRHLAGIEEEVEANNRLFLSTRVPTLLDGRRIFISIFFPLEKLLGRSRFFVLEELTGDGLAKKEVKERKT